MSVPNGSPIDPADHADPARTAHELFAHGLLSLVTAERGVNNRRIERLMDAIDREDAAPRRLVFPRAQRLAAAAALVLVGLTAAVLVLSTESSAHALIRASIAALHAPGDRRYEARRLRGEDRAPMLSTTVETREGGFLLIRHQAPRRGSDVVAGRDARGAWGIDREGRIDRVNPFEAVPKWAMIGNTSLFSESLDTVLAELARSFRLERIEPEPHPDRPGIALDRLVATKQRRGDGIYASRIDLWIHPATHLPERIELSGFPSGINRPANVPPPPRRVIIDRVDPEPLPVDWFNAERWGRP